MAEKMADWPYDDDAAPEEVTELTWRCPDDKCDCAKLDEEAPMETFSVLLRSHEGETMPGARCRVLVHDRVVNEDTPNADGEGRLTVEIPRTPLFARVEWAPADTPKGPIYPYRRRYYVDVKEQPRVEAARRRLHNLGFSTQEAMRENVKAYQRHYGFPDINGFVDEIEDELTAHHDDGVVPSPPPAPPEEEPREEAEVERG